MNKKTLNKVKYIYLIIIGLILIFYKDINNITTDVKNNLEYIKCGSAEHIPKPIPQITTVGYTLITVGTPLILIIFSIISMVKSLSGGNSDEIDKARKNLIKKFIIAAVIFFTAFIVQFVVNKVSANDEDQKTATACIKCFLYLECGESKAYHDDPGNRTSTINRSNWVNSNVKSNSNKKSNILDPHSKTSNNTSNTSNTSVTNNTESGWEEGTFGQLDYMFYKPEKVSVNKPLIIYLHGRDEFKNMGGNLKKLDAYGFSYMIKNNKKEINAYVLIPNAPNYNAGWASNDADLMGLIEKLINENGIDKNRITLTGFSAGAEALTDYISKHPGYFSNVIIFARNNPITPSMFEKLHTWVVWGEGDSYSNTRCPTIYTQLSKAGYDVRKDSYPLKHDGKIINNTIEKSDFMDFINQPKK